MLVPVSAFVKKSPWADPETRAEMLRNKKKGGRGAKGKKRGKFKPKGAGGRRSKVSSGVGFSSSGIASGTFKMPRSVSKTKKEV